VNHSLDKIYKRVVANESKSETLILNLLSQKRLIEIELPSRENSRTDWVFTHISIPGCQSANSILGVLSFNRTQNRDHRLNEFSYQGGDVSGHQVNCVVLDGQHILVIKLVSSINSFLY